MANYGRKNSMTTVLIVIALILLAVGVTAAITKGFTDTNPYGWLPEFDKLEEGDSINGFEFNLDSEIDFEKLIKDLKPEEGDSINTYALVETKDPAVYVNVVETVSKGEDSIYNLVVNGNTVYDSETGWNESFVKDGVSFEKVKITSVENARALSYYLGGVLNEESDK